MNRYQSRRNHPAWRFLSMFIVLQVVLFQCVPGFILSLAAQEADATESVSTGDQEPRAIAVDVGGDEGKEAAAETEDAEGEEGEEEFDYVPLGMPLPPAEVTVAGRFGDGQFETYGGVLVPLYYGEDFGLLYINPRYSFTDFDEEEFNLGVGWRNIFEVNDYDFILGGNVFYDSRWTQYDNQFDQLGLGAEFLSKWVDARYNYYLPDDDKELARSFETEEVRASTSVQSGSSTSMSTAIGPITPSGNTISQTATTTARTTTRTTRTTTTTTTRFLFEQFEAALEGFDAEIGFLVPLIDQFVPTRIFIGYQDFQNPFGKDLDGIKGRLEARLLPGLTLDVELFENEVLNGTDYYIGARAHVPLDLQNLANGRNPFEGTKERFQPSAEEQALAKRLTENVGRDPRLLTNLSDLIENVAARTVTTRSHSSTSASTVTRNLGPETFVLFRGIFVNNANTTGAEDGTFENPWNTIQEGVDATDASFDYNVYTFKGTGPYRENVVVAKDNVNLRSEAKPLFGIDGTVFGGTGMRPVVDGNVAGVNGPAFRISGQNVTLDAYEIIRSPGGSNPGLRDITGKHVIDGAGIVAENASGLNLIDVKTTGNTYGALLVHDGSQSGAPADFTQSIRGLDAAGNSVANLAVDALGAGGAMNLAVMGADLSGGGGDGLQIFAEGFDTAAISLDDIAADGNAGDGIIADVTANGPVLLALMNVDADNNGGEAISLTAESLADAVTVTVAGAMASGSGGNGLTVDATGANGASVMLGGVIADGNAGEGIVVDADGGAGPAEVALAGASASGNQGGDGVDISVAGDGPVMLTLADVMANENRNRGVNVDVNSDGNIAADLTSIVATLNGSGLLGLGLTPAGEGIRVILDSDNGEVALTGSQLVAIGNNDDGITIEVDAETGATVDLSQVQANMNRFDGLDVEARAKGPVEATLNGITADGNGLAPLLGATGIEVNLRSTDSTVLLTGSGLAASGNDGDGIKTRLRGHTGATADLDGLVANNNDGKGIDIDVTSLDLGLISGTDGPASLSLSNVSASGNRFDGVDARVVSDGAVDVTLASVLADGNGTGLLLGGDGIRVRAISHNDNVTVNGIGLSASGNDGDGIKTRLRGHTGATADLDGLVANNNDGKGIDIDVTSLDLGLISGTDGPASLSLSNVSASGNRFDGVDARVVSDGAVDVTLASVLADGNGTGLLLGGDGIRVRAISHNDNVTVNGIGLSASGNDGDGVKARLRGHTGATANLDGLVANNNDGKGIDIDVTSLDLGLISGTDGPASLSLSNVSASGNRFDGVDARVVSDGAVDVTLASVLADGNGTGLLLGGDGIRVRAISHNDNVTINGTGLLASDNDGDGIDTLARSRTGFATSIIDGATANRNTRGIVNSAVSRESATVGVTNSTANENAMSGIRGRVQTLGWNNDANYDISGSTANNNGWFGFRSIVQPLPPYIFVNRNIVTTGASASGNGLRDFRPALP